MSESELLQSAKEDRLCKSLDEIADREREIAKLQAE